MLSKKIASFDKRELFSNTLPSPFQIVLMDQNSYDTAPSKATTEENTQTNTKKRNASPLFTPIPSRNFEAKQFPGISQTLKKIIKPKAMKFGNGKNIANTPRPDRNEAAELPLRKKTRNTPPTIQTPIHVGFEKMKLGSIT